MKVRIPNAWEIAEKLLRERGLPRTRANCIHMIYDKLPEHWDDEAEEDAVPPDLRINPAPDVPFPTTH